jgi:hypothetical protein
MAIYPKVPKAMSKLAIRTEMIKCRVVSMRVLLPWTQGDSQEFQIVKLGPDFL